MTSTHPLKVSVQRAHHTHDESELLGTMSAQEVLSAYDKIDWLQQAAQAEELQKVAPTFSVERGPSLLWVSVAGQPPQIEFVSSYSVPGQVKRLFGLMTSDGIIEKHRPDLTPSEARQAIEAFVVSDSQTLAKLFDA